MRLYHFSQNLNVIFDYKHAILALKNDAIILKYLTGNQDSSTRKQLIIQFPIVKFFRRSKRRGQPNITKTEPWLFFIFCLLALVTLPFSNINAVESFVRNHVVRVGK